MGAIGTTKEGGFVALKQMVERLWPVIIPFIVGICVYLVLMKPVGRARKIFEWFFPVPTFEESGAGPTSFWPVMILIMVGVCVYYVLGA